MMFHRKGLFWNSPKKRYFDFSTSLTGSVFGHKNSYLSKRIKNTFKKNYLIDISPSICSNTIKLQFSSWIHRYPYLNKYRFYPVSDLDLLHFLKTTIIPNTKIIAKSWEINHDPLLYYLSNETNTPPKSDTIKTLITDIALMYPNEYSTLYKKPDKKSIEREVYLYLNSCFPEIFGFEDIEPLIFSVIIVGGKNPFSLNAQKLLLINEDIPDLIPRKIISVNHWHLKVYRDGIKHYYDFLKRPIQQNRKKAFRETLQHIQDWGNQKKKKIQINSRTFSAQIILMKKKTDTQMDSSKLSELTWYNNRIFYKDITIIAEEDKEKIIFYLHLPINFSPQHLKNKWKGLVSLLDLV